MPKKYIINTLNDFAKVPSERRPALFKDLLYALELHDLAAGQDDEIEFYGMDWTDDGKHDVNIQDQHGESLIGLKVTQA